MNFNDYLKEVDRPFHGWDFSYITGAGRMQSGLLPWSYGSMARNFLHGARAVLDMGTGEASFWKSSFRFRCIWLRQRGMHLITRWQRTTGATRSDGGSCRE